MKYSHIVWTTFDTVLPHEKRGNWQGLAELYKSLKSDFVVNFSKPLQESYRYHQNDNQIILSNRDQELLKEEILNLIKDDRVASGLKTLSIGVTSNGVHILIKGELDETKQKLARLKSRSATLLSYSTLNPSITGKNTWSKGFWAAEFNEHHDVFKIKAYINQLGE